MRNAAFAGSIVAILFAVMFSAGISFVSAQPPPQSENVGISIEVPGDVEQIPDTGPGPADTRAGVLVEGYGPPQALLYILKDGAVARTVGIPSSGIFSESIGGLSPGATTIGVFAYDTDNLTTPTISVGIVLHAATITRIFDILLPPTIQVDKDVAREGERIIVSGQTFPRASVTATRSPDRQRQEVLADRSGRWEVIYATDNLIGPYTVTARAALSSGLRSEESESVALVVIPRPGREPIPPRLPEEAPPPRPEGPPPLCADPNGDRLVNLSDFSIFLFHWGSPKDPRVDCNGDGVIDLIDLSIMFFWWTG